MQGYEYLFNDLKNVSIFLGWNLLIKGGETCYAGSLEFYGIPNLRQQHCEASSKIRSFMQYRMQ